MPPPESALTPSPTPTPVPSQEPEETEEQFQNERLTAIIDAFNSDNWTSLKEEESLAPEPEEIETTEPAPLPKPAPFPGSYQVFEIEYLKLGAAIGASFTVSKVLGSEYVSCFIQVNDRESHNTDYSYDCYLEVLNPDGKTIYSWKGNYENDNNHRFDFFAIDRGKYIISFTHHSLYPKVLYLKISPQGWTYEGN
jgi:hypothetical protein